MLILFLILWFHFCVLLLSGCSLVFCVLWFWFCFFCVCVPLFVFVSLVLLLPFVWGFVCLFLSPFVCFCACYLSRALFLGLFLSLSFFPLLCYDVWIAGSNYPAGGWAWASSVGAQSLRHWTSREFLAPGNIYQWEFSQRSLSQMQERIPPKLLQAPVLDASLPNSKQERNTNSSISRQAV